MLLEGRRAIVTRSSGGIGKAGAERLGQEGANVCVNYYCDNDAGEARSVVAALEQAGVETFAVQADVGDEGQVIAMVAHASGSFRAVDPVNHTGIERHPPLLEMPLDPRSSVIATNLSGTFLCTFEAGKERYHHRRPRRHVALPEARVSAQQ